MHFPHLFETGNIGSCRLRNRTIPPQDSPFAPLADLAAQIKAVVNIPVVAIGKINRPDVAEDIISRGQADFVAMARALVADPDFPRKAESNTRDEEIRPCVACLEDCIGNGVEGIGRCCTVNPFAGHEFIWKIKPVEAKKKILVIGGGPGGVQAALVASRRGHAVELWEQSGKIGGQIQFAHLAPFKEEMAGILTYLIKCLEKSPVKVRTGHQANHPEIAVANPDVVAIEDKQVRLKRKDDSEFILEVDLVVIGINAQPEDGLLHALQGGVKELFVVGDAAAPGNLGAALRNATEVALNI